MRHTMDDSVETILHMSTTKQGDKWRTECWANLTDEERWIALAVLVAAMAHVPVPIDETDDFADLQEAA